MHRGSFRRALLLGHPCLPEHVSPGAAPRAAGRPSAGRLPERLPVPLIWAADLSSPRPSFLAVDQHEPRLETTCPRRPARWSAGPPRRPGHEALVPSLFCPSAATWKSVPRAETTRRSVCCAFGPQRCGGVAGRAAGLWPDSCRSLEIHRIAPSGGQSSRAVVLGVRHDKPGPPWQGRSAGLPTKPRFPLPIVTAPSPHRQSPLLVATDTVPRERSRARAPPQARPR